MKKILLLSLVLISSVAIYQIGGEEAVEKRAVEEPESRQGNVTLQLLDENDLAVSGVHFSLVRKTLGSDKEQPVSVRGETFSNPGETKFPVEELWPPPSEWGLEWGPSRLDFIAGGLVVGSLDLPDQPPASGKLLGRVSGLAWLELDCLPAKFLEGKPNVTYTVWCQDPETGVRAKSHSFGNYATVQRVPVPAGVACQITASWNKEWRRAGSEPGFEVPPMLLGETYRWTFELKLVTYFGLKVVGPEGNPLPKGKVRLGYRNEDGSATPRRPGALFPNFYDSHHYFRNTREQSGDIMLIRGMGMAANGGDWVGEFPMPDRLTEQEVTFLGTINLMPEREVLLCSGAVDLPPRMPGPSFLYIRGAIRPSLPGRYREQWSEMGRVFQLYILEDEKGAWENLDFELTVHAEGSSDAPTQTFQIGAENLSFTLTAD